MLWLPAAAWTDGREPLKLPVTLRGVSKFPGVLLLQQLHVALTSAHTEAPSRLALSD